MVRHNERPWTASARPLETPRRAEERFPDANPIASGALKATGRRLMNPVRRYPPFGTNHQASIVVEPPLGGTAPAAVAAF